MRAPMMTFTGVFGLDALSEYRTEKRSSSIVGKTSSAKTFAQEFKRTFCSRGVKTLKQSKSEICWDSFVRNDMVYTSNN